MANESSDCLPERTFQYQDSLPPLPVPSLEGSLAKYLDAVRPFATQQEYEATVENVRNFKEGIGQVLHQKLLHRARTKRNWLEEWWLDAYLELRMPSQLNVNFGGPAPYLEHCWPPAEGTQLQRTSVGMWYTLQYWDLIRTERLAPHKAGRAGLDMDQYRMLFCTCKVPGVSKDTILNYFKTETEGPCPSHVVVMCRGRVFTFDTLCNGKILTPPELLRQLKYVTECCEGEPAGDGVAALTSEERTTWAKAREHLISIDPANKSILESIQSSLFVVSLDEAKPYATPENYTPLTLGSLTGDPTIRWGDKSYNSISYADGTFACNCDHAPYDGMILVSMSYYIDCQLKATDGKWEGSDMARTIPLPEELIFKMDDRARQDVQLAKQHYLETTQNLQLVCCAFTSFGKAAIKQRKLYSDTFVQLAMQLAYYRKHGRPGSCYETAMTRRFYHGRTETMRPCTQETVVWCHTMQDPTCSDDVKRQALLKAFNKHNQLMAEAQNGEGFDRHLLGLYLIAKNEGFPIPQLFMDPLYAKRIVMSITAWKSDPQTDAESLFQTLSHIMENQLSGSLPERTFQYQDSLPPLPVPSLEGSLAKYLDAVRPFATQQEYEATVENVRNFKEGIGQVLHQKLLHRARTKRNWLEEWWLDVAYLELRMPSQLNVNFGGPAPYLEHCWPPAEGTQLQRTSVGMWYTLQYWDLIRTERLAPHKAGRAGLDMDQYRMLFCTCKVPGVSKDTILNYFKTETEGPCPSHVVVMCRGRLKYVTECCEGEPAGDGVAALTSEERTTWAKAREHLISIDPANKSILESIQSSLFVLTLETLVGDPTIRWGDKSYNSISYADGTFGSNCDHSPYDAMILVSLCYYIDQQLEATDGKWTTQNLQLVCCAFTSFGKAAIKQRKLHPDTFIQLAMQLAYYRKHGRPGSCYETAMTRRFYHGRTETMRPCTQEAVVWCHTMQDPTCSDDVKRKALLKAFNKHNHLMAEAQNAEGFDRHLLGMYLVAKEEGLPVPPLFMDPLYGKSGGGGNFVLSSSLVGYTTVLGAVAPMVPHGYGFFYRIRDDKIVMSITAWKSDPQTDAESLFQTLCASLHDVLQLATTSQL
ncbi:hypothetical protein CRUP_034919 [Coryphaenoides rupestris]|nr:hypothetical protein CRUP_034919 [Coryphaenoides rupestris]